MEPLEQTGIQKDSLMDVFFIKRVRRKRVFIAVSFVTVPALAYVYTLPITLISWLIMDNMGMSVDSGLSASMVAKLVYCGFASFATHYYVWEHRKKKIAALGSRKSLY